MRFVCCLLEFKFSPVGADSEIAVPTERICRDSHRVTVPVISLQNYAASLCIAPRPQRHSAMQAHDFEQRLKAQTDFPSPSRVASEVIHLARDPENELAKVTESISRDPAMAAKILRIANSAFYTQRRASQNLRQALVVIGLNAALTLALSFSLVSALRASSSAGIDYPRFWRRALLAATAARAVGERVARGQEEDIFLAALLQDLAILAIDRIQRGFYAGLPSEANHADLSRYETAKLGHDHAYYTAILLRGWNLPERICYAAEHSHAPELASEEDARFIACVALGSELADAMLTKERAVGFDAVSQRATELLDLSSEQLAEVIDRILKLTPEIAAVYDTSIIDGDDADALLAEARELLAVRNLHALQEVSALRATTSVLKSRTEALEDASRRDPLTSAINRAWFDRMLESHFAEALASGAPLSLAYVDIDHYKQVNERFGTEVGDKLLASCVQAMNTCIRSKDGGRDFVARFAGEEFMVVLPGADVAGAQRVAQRMLTAIARTELSTSEGKARATASIGLVSHLPEQPIASASALLAAADHALYAAKLRGRNRVECFDDFATQMEQRKGA
jgi:diguanylate cyclase (GGDEF)-like protein